MKRRTLLQVAAASAAVFAATPSWAQARGQVLVAGLPTDEAFAQGTGLDRRLALSVDVPGYAALVQSLRHAPGMDWMALLDARHALLLEQAARDSGAVVLAYRPVHESQARAAGQWLASESARPLPHLTSAALVALRLRT
ncbi:MAG: hypothetical protein L6Q74_05495 [Sphaerotilus natans subsp. sulfidivorans]|uniref:hypothetical protein n=1 Tax=Sphaerotilus sulfidivorans TaxID=639200 RepID=UPI002352B8EE|nr:hypothetical protein [Sphaerotilus sulfidivorans]MCK6401354.1 hypothetical protein [Sphaerotilus sulfidivorans]